MRGSGANASKMNNDMNAIEIFMLVWLLVGVLPTWPHNANEKMAPAGD